uniref:Uncharacterized protein n=1 Tax=Macrostomum lignano TaxID=282301 RepID=A0A1I8GZA6_9PLAT
MSMSRQCSSQLVAQSQRTQRPQKCRSNRNPPSQTSPTCSFTGTTSSPAAPSLPVLLHTLRLHRAFRGPASTRPAARRCLSRNWPSPPRCRNCCWTWRSYSTPGRCLVSEAPLRRPLARRYLRSYSS